jgi:magnesium-transporting ATPase (P-type)
MPTNLAQGLLIIIALLAGNIIPLTPVLILWMNMATSATLSFGLAFEAAERNVMNRPPRKTGQHVMDGSPCGAWPCRVHDCYRRLYP